MTNVSLPRRASRPEIVAAFLILAGCASASRPAPRAEPDVPPSVAATVSELLQPSPAALRTADRVELTGLELGTMWTFENPPLEYWEDRYGFQATPEWLEDVRLSSVRYGEYCSASFVSPDGLVMTNHHCARECIEAVSTEQVDYVVEGFYAPTREEEPLCPGLFLDQLVDIEDVTLRVQGAVPADASDTEIAAAQEAAREAIESECETASDFECQVVPLYHGGQYQLYTYRRYAPVKLVFAPELQAGFFGGDPDNFTYPRYALDVAFVRAYQPAGDAPARTPNYFTWDPDGASEGELVFITGNPGSTSRQATVAQLQYEKLYRHPFILSLLEAQRDFLVEISERGPEAARQVRDRLFSVENSIKSYSGQLAGLQDTLLMGRKIRWERQFRRAVQADRSLRTRYGGVWDRIAEIQAEKLRISPRLNAVNVDLLGAPHLQLAGMLVRYIRATAMPEAERPEAIRGAALPQMEQQLRSDIQLGPEVGARLLAMHLDIADRWLPPEDSLRAVLLPAGATPDQVARRLVRETRVGDVAFRRSLIEGGLPALEASTDPLVRLAARMESEYGTLLARWEEVIASESVQEERLAMALFGVFGTDVPPDATFTLRISDGVVLRYPYNGTVAPPSTSFFGMYERAANFDNEMPWTLPETFAERRDAVDMATPLDFVTTNDITGGNSGSPMIDREARIIGIAFDGNIQQLPNEFLYRQEAARSIGVHSAGILEALQDVYQADALVAELLGTR